MPQSFVRPGEGANRPRPEPSTTADGPAIRSILYLAPVAALLVGLGAALADSTPSIGEILTTVIVPTIVGVFVLIGRTRPAFLRAAAYGLFVEAILAGCFATVGLAFAVVLPMVGVALVQPQLRGRQMIGALVAAGVAAIAGVTAAAVVGPARTLFAEMPVIVPIAGFATIVTFGLALQWRANRQLFGALALAEGEIAARDRAEAELDRTSEILSAIVRSSPVATQAFDLDRNVTIWNPASERIFGWSADEVVGRPMPLAMTPPEERMPSQARIARTIQGGVATGDRVRRLTKDGEERWIDIYAAPLRDRRGTTIGIAGQLVDVTERVQLEAQLLHAQKMEAIGLLASGLAHDFNNTLTVAGGFAELIKAETADADVATDAAAIIEVVEKARELTQRLLAVARDTSRPSEPVDVCGVVVELAPLLRQLLGGTIEVELELPDRPMVACLDTCQLEQALINLAVNARDAMPDGGTITIGVRATDATIDAAGGSAAAASPGALVEIFVRDTGTGIAADILEQVFEPFFTTKATGKGSGLGLAMVSGFAARTGGEVTVASDLGVGTTFAIRLPEVALPSVATARVRAEGSKPKTGRRSRAPQPSAAGLHARAS
jgi:PAS domain S-box-containing protein